MFGLEGGGLTGGGVVGSYQRGVYVPLKELFLVLKGFSSIGTLKGNCSMNIFMSKS